MQPYRGRFAPSPTGLLHAGSLVAALASWLDARAHGGQWLLRMEDVDTPRCVAGADHAIVQQLARCGLLPDEPPVWQSQRSTLYQQALDTLVAQQRAYPCACTRSDIERAWQRSGHTKPRHGELIYPGTCRQGLQGRPERAWRLHTGLHIGLHMGLHVFQSKMAVSPVECAQAASKTIANTAPPPTATHLVQWTDRRLGPQSQDVEHAVGDFVLRRSDGLWAYQLAVVVDDAAQGITHIVRGQDLADNTARQILLQQALDLPTPQYLHTPLVLGANGEKLSKQNGAQPLDLHDPLAVQAALNTAAQVLDLPAQSGSVPDALALWVRAWAALWPSASTNNK